MVYTFAFSGSLVTMFKKQTNTQWQAACLGTPGNRLYMNMDSPFRGSSSAAHRSRSVPGGRLYKQAFNFLELSQSTWRQTTQITNKQLDLPSQPLDYQAQTSLHITESQNIINYHPEQSRLNTFHVSLHSWSVSFVDASEPPERASRYLFHLLDLNIDQNECHL